MRHYSEKELVEFIKIKDYTIEKHLRECKECSMKYNFLRTKLGIKSYVEYERLKEERSDCISLEKLELYSAGKISEEEKKRIKNHLTCCRKCADSYFNLASVNVKSLWSAIEETVSETADWIGGVFFLPSLAVGRDGKGLDTSEVFIGDEVEVEIPVAKEGYISVLHWNKENVTLVFPNSYEKDNFVEKDSKKEFKVRIDPPAGKQVVKVIVTEDNLLEPEKLNFDDENSVLRDIDKFVKKLDGLPDDKWSQEKKVYKVKEL